jgi:hypothetical protein
MTEKRRAQSPKTLTTMISSRALHIYLGTTVTLGGYYAGRATYTSPRWLRNDRDQSTPAGAMITRSMTTMVGTAMGALAGPIMIPYQAFAGIWAGFHDWAQEREARDGITHKGK